MRGAVSFAAAVAAIAGGMAFVVAEDGFPGDGTDPSCSCRPRHSLHRVRKAGRWDYTYPAEHWRFWWYANRARLTEVTHRAASNAVTTQPAAKQPAGAPEPWRDAVRSALHSVLSAKSRVIVSEAALSLGRGGDARDARALAAIVVDTDRDPKERSRAALGLALVDVDKAPADAKQIRDALLAAAREARGNYDDRCELWGNCLYALGVRGDPAALPAVREIAVAGASARDQDLHRDVVCSAASALGMFEDDLVVPDLVDLVRRPEEGGDKRRAMYVSVYAAHGLATLGSHTALAALCEAAGDEREEVRRAVAMAIGALAGPEDDAAHKVLAQMAREDRFVSCRNMACIGLGRSRHPGAVRVLMDIATKRPASDRPYALLGLGLFARPTKDAAVRAFLGERLADSGSADEIGAIATANGLAENEAAIPRLLALTDGGEPELRGWAAYALGLLHSRDRRLAPRLHEMVLDQGDPIVRREAALALGLVGDARAVPALCGIVRRGKNVIDRGSAAVALGRIGGSDAADCLIDVLRNEDEPQELRACVAEGLGYLLDKDEGRRLSRIVSDLDWYELTEPTMRALYLVD